MRITTLCLLSLFALACAPEKGDATTDTTSDSLTTGGTPTTGDASTTGGAATTGEPSTTEASSTGTTDDPTGEMPAQCVDYCANLEACDSPDSEGCAEQCALGLVMYQHPGAACAALYGDFLTCKTTATCAELADSACSDEPELLAVDDCTIELCDNYADRLIECDLADPDLKLARASECTMAMLSARFERSEACGDATEATVACAISGTCEQINDVEFCAAEAAAANEACG